MARQVARDRFIIYAAAAMKQSSNLGSVGATGNYLWSDVKRSRSNCTWAKAAMQFNHESVGFVCLVGRPRSVSYFRRANRKRPTRRKLAEKPQRRLAERKCAWNLGRAETQFIEFDLRAENIVGSSAGGANWIACVISRQIWFCLKQKFIRNVQYNRMINFIIVGGIL